MKDQSALREHLVELHQVCPGCGKPVNVNDQLHHWAHVFRRLPEPWKWHEIFVIPCHAACHQRESAKFNYECAKMKLEAYGWKEIEAVVASVPTKTPIILTECYYQARLTVFGF